MTLHSKANGLDLEYGFLKSAFLCVAKALLLCHLSISLEGPCLHSV